MPNFRYSRWDGTQQIMPFDADAIMEAISEDVLMHGDVRRALEKLMQQGYKFQTGERMPGLRDLMDRLKAQRQDTLRRNSMDSIIKDIQERLDKVKETERAGIDRRVEEGRQQSQQPQASEQDQQSGGESSNQDGEITPEQREQLQKMLENMAKRRREQLDNLPNDLGGQIKGLREYDFMDSDARQQFQDLMNMLQQQMMQNQFSGLQQGMQEMQQNPAAMEETREMLRDLNQMLRDREEGKEPRFEEFMQKHGHHFPPGIENLDQLLEHLQQQMQRMENMLNSMSPGQRQQLMSAMDSLMQDPGLRDEIAELAQHLGPMMSSQGARQYRFSGDPDELLEHVRSYAGDGSIGRT